MEHFYLLFLQAMCEQQVFSPFFYSKFKFNRFYLKIFVLVSVYKLNLKFKIPILVKLWRKTLLIRNTMFSFEFHYIFKQKPCTVKRVSFGPLMEYFTFHNCMKRGVITLVFQQGSAGKLQPNRVDFFLQEKVFVQSLLHKEYFSPLFKKYFINKFIVNIKKYC